MTNQTTPAADLAEAEEWARAALDRTVPSHLVTLLAEYDRRGAELDRLQLQDLSLLRAYLTKVANRLGRADLARSYLRTPVEIETVGEQVLAELERLRGIERRAQEGDVHADERTDALLRWILHGGITP